jgi:hypothetical protein
MTTNCDDASSAFLQQLSLNEGQELVAQHAQPNPNAASYFPPQMVGAPMMYYPLPAAVPPLPGMPLLPLGVSGLPHARPYFYSVAENGIRHPRWCCQEYNPGVRIPPHWYDGGKGWVTKYFYDAVLRNPATYTPGTFRCQVRRPDGQLCNEQVEEGDCCKGHCCWQSYGLAPDMMMKHLTSAHGLAPPPRREWATGLFETEGCFDVLCCIQCNGARQMMALSGWEDTMHWGWCLFFTFLSCRSIGSGNERAVIIIPPWIYVAMCTRYDLIELNNIDEHCCTSILNVICCAPCSVAQTYRELAASGVWAGSVCGERFGNYGTIGAPKSTLQQVMQ